LIQKTRLPQTQIFQKGAAGIRTEKPSGGRG
jgi:hypothetical protein